MNGKTARILRGMARRACKGSYTRYRYICKKLKDSYKRGGRVDTPAGFYVDVDLKR